MGRNTSFENEPPLPPEELEAEYSPPSTPSSSSTANLKQPVIQRERSTSAPNVSLNSVNVPSNFLEVSCKSHFQSVNQSINDIYTAP